MDVRKLPPVLTRSFLWIAGLTMAFAVAVHVATYGPDQIAPSLMNVALALFFVMFLVFGPAVVVFSLARIPPDRLYAGLPLFARIVGGALVLYVFVDFFAMMQFLPGQPEQDGSKYYFNNHGDLIPISANAYRMALMHAARLFSGHELLFFGVAALIAYQIEGIRSGRVNIDATPHDEAMEHARLPYPLQRIVNLRTMLSPEICAERLLAPQLRSAWSFFDTSRELRGEASAAGFRVEIKSAQSQLVYAVGRFEGDAGGTSIRLLLTFRRGTLIFLAASAFFIPVVWAVMNAFGFPLPWFLVAIVVVFGVGANFLFGLDQRRRLLAMIKRATDAHEVQLPADLPG